MPQIPIDVQREVTQATPAAPMQSLAEAGRLGQSLGQFGSAADAFQNEQDARSAADTKLKLHTFSAEFKEGLAKDADYSTYETRYKDAVAKWKEQNVDGLTSGAKRMLGAGLDEAITQGGVQIRHAARLQQVDQSKAELMTSLDQARQGFGRAGGDMGAVLADGYKAIDVRLQGGVLTHVEAERQREAFRSSIADEQARMMFMADPRGFAKVLSEGKAEWLGGKDRLVWQQRAEAKVEALDAKAEREALRREREADRAEAKRQKMGAAAAANVQKIIADGYAVDPDTRAAALQAAEGTEAEAELKTTLAIEDKVSVLPVNEQKKVAETNDRRLQASGVQDHAQIALQRKLEATVKRNADRIAADPLGYSEKQGIVPTLPPLDMTNLSKSLAERTGVALDVQAYHGLDSMPLLRKTDSDSIVQAVTSAKDPRKRAEIMGAVISAAENDTAAAALLTQLERSGLPPEYRAVAEWSRRGDAAKAARIVSELQAGKEATKELKGPERTSLIADTRERFNGSVGKVFDEAYNITGNAAYQLGKQQTYATVEQLALVRKVGGQDPDTALADAAPYVPISRKHLAHVLLPQGTNEREAVMGMEALRSQPAILDGYRRALQADPAYNPADGAAVKRAERAVQDLAERGTWVQVGNKFGLFPASGGGPVALLTLGDIIAAGRGAKMTGKTTDRTPGAVPRELQQAPFSNPVGGVTGEDQ